MGALVASGDAGRKLPAKRKALARGRRETASSVWGRTDSQVLQGHGGWGGVKKSIRVEALNARVRSLLSI